jgi:hypothetical protein
VTTRRKRRPAVVIVCAALVVFALASANASAHPFSGWTGKSGPFRWQARMVTCGEVSGEPNRIAAHSRWLTSPANGYQRVTFRRQIQDETTEKWTTVQRIRRTTKNTAFEGTRAILHWRQFFQPVAGEAGKTSRDVITFGWRRDRKGPDRTVFSRTLRLRECVVGS